MAVIALADSAIDSGDRPSLLAGAGASMCQYSSLDSDRRGPCFQPVRLYFHGLEKLLLGSPNDVPSIVSDIRQPPLTNVVGDG